MLVFAILTSACSENVIVVYELPDAQDTQSEGTDSTTDTTIDSNTGMESDSQTDTESASETESESDSGTALVQQKGIGVLYDDVYDTSLLNVSWCFNFTPFPVDERCQPPQFVPMIWGRDQVPDMEQVAEAGYHTILGFNEPGMAHIADMTVEEAITLWPSLTVYPEIRVGSPAVTVEFQAWMNDFMAQALADNLRVDFIAIHWFGTAAADCTNGDGLEGMITWAEQWERPIWLTEFGCRVDSSAEEQTVVDFLPIALEVIARHPTVERYAWYPSSINATYNELILDGSLTALGQQYAAAASD